MNTLNLTTTDIIHGRIKRIQRIEEAIAWPSGIAEQKASKVIWVKENNQVSLNKPGKEAAPDYNRCRYIDGTSGNNPNDMLPLVSTSGNNSKNISFAEVFRDLLIFIDHPKEGELFGALLVRMAFMADYTLDDTGTFWRYSPPQDIVEQITEKIPAMFDITTESFLHYMDALAWNEDVKYYTLGYNPNQGYGGRNNLLTYANIIAAAIDKIDFATVMGGFAIPPVGISAISRTKAYEVFPVPGLYERIPTGRKLQEILDKLS